MLVHFLLYYTAQPPLQSRGLTHYHIGAHRTTLDHIGTHRATSNHAVGRELLVLIVRHRGTDDGPESAAT